MSETQAPETVVEAEKVQPPVEVPPTEPKSKAKTKPASDGKVTGKVQIPVMKTVEVELCNLQHPEPHSGLRCDMQNDHEGDHSVWTRYLGSGVPNGPEYREEENKDGKNIVYVHWYWKDPSQMDLQTGPRENRMPAKQNELGRPQ